MLKRLSLYGFKTFAKKTEIEFNKGITCIVGPNGSGKSNIADALRWVLGEQGMRTLRSDKLTEVIFAGSEYSHPLNFAEVLLLLENNSEFFPLKFSEIEIVRRIYRDNKSDFLINKTPCRLKDIQDIFLDTGLGRGGISMVGQGQVEKLINSDPLYRRALFEETAGINKYQFRKQKALKKIELTERNLLRLNDIIQEVEGRILPLKKEVNRLKRFQRYKSRIEKLEQELLLQEYFSLVAREEEIKNFLDEAAEKVEKIKSSLESLESEYKEKEQNKKRLHDSYYKQEKKLNDFKRDLDHIRGKCLSYARRRKEFNERLESITELSKSLGEQIQKIEDTKFTDKERLKELSEKIAAITRDLRLKGIALEKELNKLELVRKNYKACKEKLLTLCQNKMLLSKELEQHYRTFEELEKDKVSLELNIKENENLLVKNDTGKKKIQEELSETTDRVIEIKDLIEKLKKDKVKSADSLEQVKVELADLHRKYTKREVRFNFLKDLERDFEGYFPGVKALMKARDSNKKFSGLTGILGSLIKVDKKFEKAIEVALGGHLQDIVVENDEYARTSIDYLRENNKGRATFLPLNLIKPTFFSVKHEGGWDRLPEILGQASELIEYEGRYKNIIDYLLAHFYIVTDLKSGISILKNYNISATLVTLEGDIIRSSGSITGGSLNGKKSSLLGRSREISELSEEISGLIALKENLLYREDGFVKEIRKLENDIQEQLESLEKFDSKKTALIRDKDLIIMEEKQVKDKLNQIGKTLNSNSEKKKSTDILMGKLQRKLEKIIEEEIDLTREKEDLKMKLSEQEEKETDLTKDLTNLKIEFAKTQETFNNLKDFISSQKLQEDRIKDNYNSCKTEITTLNEQLTYMEEEEKLDNLKLNDLEKRYNQEAEIFNQIYRKKEEEEKKILKISGDISSEREVLTVKEKSLGEFQVSFAKVNTEREMLSSRIPEIVQPDFIEPKKISQELELLNQRMEEMGFVNYNAEKEFEDVNNRYSFLISQRADMEEAVFSLHRVIEESDRKSRKKFKETFELISCEFSRLYGELFPGGKGHIFLAEEEDQLKSDIEVVVNPPGKKPQSVLLLSGGEKSMAALVLLFSIFKVKPTPFCVFDEADAALDDANTVLFSECLKEFSRSSQFIVISHNKLTMEKADVLYGITSEEPGISGIISLKLGDPVLEKFIAQEAVV